MDHCIKKYDLINIFYILSFLTLTYTYNIYVLYALFYCIIAFLYKPLQKDAIIIFLFLILSSFYTIYVNAHSGYRVIKTLLVFLPVIIAVNIGAVKVSKLLHYFLLLNASLIYIDLLLHYSLGITLTPIVFSANTPRLGGLIEDSNFFSYTILAYIQYLYLLKGRYNYFLVFSLLFSFSFSAISFFMLIVILNFLKFKKYKFIIPFTILILVIYYSLVYMSQNLRGIAILYDNDLIKNKIISMAIRFEGQSEVFKIVNSLNTFLFGTGAGATQEIVSTGLNLHNSYLQIILEMGFGLFLPVVGFIIFFLKRINKIFLLLFCIIILVGNILEVVYYPLISFIYFLSKSYENQIYGKT